MPTSGFGTVSIADIIINGSKVAADVEDAITDVVLESTIAGASTVSISVTDPFRTLLRQTNITQGATLTFLGLDMTCIEITKSQTLLTYVFETTGIYLLSQERGVTASSTTTTITSFVAGLVAAVPQLKFVGFYSPAIFTVAVARGSSDDPEEDSWTCIQRIAGTAGWRAWSYNTVVYFGPDTFWMQKPAVATFQEFTPMCLNMDFDWDYGQPFGNIQATCMTGLITFAPGQVGNVITMGVANGPWLVNAMQRDLYNPEATVTLQVPLTPAEVLTNIPTAQRAMIEALASNAATTTSSSTSPATTPVTAALTGATTAGPQTNVYWAKVVLSHGGWPSSGNNLKLMLNWMAHENSFNTWTGTAGANNPLNNGLGSGGGAGLGSYSDLQTAAAYAAKGINGGITGMAPAVPNCLKRNAPTATTRQAIRNSTWASSHYPSWTATGNPPSVTAAQSAANGASKPVKWT